MASTAPETATATPRTALSEEGVRLLLPVVYASLFDFAVTEDELLRHASAELTRERARSLLDGELAALVSRTGGYVALRGGEPSVDVRRRSLGDVAHAWATARRRSVAIGRTPFVRGLLVTGSLSHENFNQDADIDFLVLVAPRRLFTVFAVLGTAQRLTSVKVLCPNYYLATDRLALPDRDYFIAREVLAATPVAGPEACAAFQRENRWAFELFPNASPRPAVDVPRPGGGLKRAVERILGGRLGDAVEGLMRRLLLSRIDAHYRACGVPLDPVVVREAEEGFRLRFHARLHRERIRNRLAGELRLLGVEPPAGLLEGQPA